MRVLPELLLEDPLEELLDELFEEPELLLDERDGVERLLEPVDLLPVYPFDELLRGADFDTARLDVLTLFLYCALLLDLGRLLTFF